MIPDSKLAEWRRLADEATGGKWGVSTSQTYAAEVISDLGKKSVTLARLTTPKTSSDYDKRKEEARANAVLMAASREALPALLDRVEELEKALAEAFDFHCRVECISEGKEPCSCGAFERTRAAISGDGGGR